MAKKILVVDPSLVSRLMIQEIIESVDGDWEVIQAASADKALQACEETQFDFITFDFSADSQGLFDSSPVLDSFQADAKIGLMAKENQTKKQQKARARGWDIIDKPICADNILKFVTQS